MRQKILLNKDFNKQDYEAVSQFNVYIESIGNFSLEGKQLKLEMDTLLSSSSTGYHNGIALSKSLISRYEKFYIDAYNKIIKLEKL